MSSYIYTHSRRVTGNVYPRRFVMADTASDFACKQATAGARTIGISQPGTHDAPGLNGSSGYAAQAGDQLHFYGAGAQDIVLALGTGGCAADDYLKPDADGKGVKAQNGELAGARALAAGALGETARVDVIEPVVVGLSGVGGTGAVTLVGTTPYALTAADSGKTFYTTIADVVFTLPATQAGLYFDIINGVLSVSTGLSVSPVSADQIIGNGFTPLDDKDAINSGASDAIGDRAQFSGNGTTGYTIVVVKGTWARES